MLFLELAKARRSVRSFQEKDVPEPLITELLQAAVEAPSGGNCQPWHFFVIRDKSIMERIHQEAIPGQAFLLTAPVLIVVCVNPNGNSQYGERGRTLYALQDTAAAVENILLCATSLELGACWCGGFNEEAIANILTLENLRPVALIPVGYPANNMASKPRRKSLADIVTYIYPADHTPILENTPCSQMVFEHADMAGALFQDLNLSDSRFDDINMQGTIFTNMNMTQATIDNCNLSHMAIDNCLLTGVTINGHDIESLLNS